MKKNLLGIIAGIGFVAMVGGVSYVATDIIKDGYRSYLEKRDKEALGLSVAGFIAFGYCLNALNKIDKQE